MEAEGFRYSYDMLGEAALTSEDAKRYYASYEQAIHAIGKASPGAASTKGRASPSSSRPCTRATAARSSTA
jgi:RHH-type proline utilization regulon transcriptional repressor/proline dehydrogenase/delta 1-pyrroline-5-carboxylate dehydrogenase